MYLGVSLSSGGLWGEGGVERRVAVVVMIPVVYTFRDIIKESRPCEDQHRAHRTDTTI